MPTKVEISSVRTKQINFRVDAEVYEAVNKRVKSLGKTKSEYLKDLVIADLRLFKRQELSSNDCEMIMRRLDEIDDYLRFGR